MEPEPKALYCGECRIYYNASAGPHICYKAEIDRNRKQLERWLGEYTVKEG